MLAIVTASALSGCASTSQKMVESMSQLPAVGLPAGAPERPAEVAAYPAVHDIPPPRNSVILTGIEQQKLEDDLMAARDHQQKSVGIKAQPKTKRQVRQEQELRKLEQQQQEPARPIVPVTSKQSIY